MLLPDGSVVGTPSEIAAELKRHWSAVFSEQMVEAGAFDEWAARLVDRIADLNFDFDADDIKLASTLARESAAGPDALPLPATCS